MCLWNVTRRSVFVFYFLFVNFSNNKNFFSCMTIVYLQYGIIEEMNVCDNLGDHLVGNVYIKVELHVDGVC